MSLNDLKAFFSEVEDKPIVKHQEEENNKHSPVLTAYIARDKRTQEQYLKMANNIKKSEKLRIKINKDIKTDVPREDILLMALECISLMTGDITFYKDNIKYIKELTG